MARNQVSDLNLCDTPLVGQFTFTLLWVEFLLGASGIRDHHLESRSSQYTLQWGDTPQVVTSSQSTPYPHSFLFSGLPQAELGKYSQVKEGILLLYPISYGK